MTVPAGRTFSLNGVTYTTSANLLLAAGSYSLSTTSPQATGAGSQAVFVSWSDGGALSHQINVAAPVSITGTFKTQYLLTASAVPANEGTVSQSGSSGSGPWYDAGSVVLLQPLSNPGYTFNSWSGACAAGTLSLLLFDHQRAHQRYREFRQGVRMGAAFAGQQSSRRNRPARWFTMLPASSLSWWKVTPRVVPRPCKPGTFNGSALEAATPAESILPGASWPGLATIRRAAQAMVLFGGQAEKDGSFLNDTWLWNGVNWTQTSPAANPPGMITLFACLATPRAAKAVLFGFPGSARCYGKPDLGVERRQLGAGNFLHIIRPHAGARRLVYDAANQVVVLFGGGRSLQHSRQ